MLVEKNNTGELRAVGTKLNITQGRFYLTHILGLQMHYYIALTKSLSKPCLTRTPKFTFNV